MSFDMTFFQSISSIFLCPSLTRTFESVLISRTHRIKSRFSEWTVGRRWSKITSTSEILCVHAIDSLLTWNCYKYKSLFWIWSAFHALIIFFRGEGGYWSFQSVHVHGVPAVSVPSWKIGSWRAVAFLSLSLWLLLDLIGRDLTSQADRRTVSTWTNSLTNKRNEMKKIPKRTLSSFLTSARKSSFRHFLENIPGSYVKWVVFFMRKHGASFDFAWFHDNNINDYRGNNNLWTILNLISDRSGRVGTKSVLVYMLDKNTLHRPAAWLY